MRNEEHDDAPAGSPAAGAAPAPGGVPSAASPGPRPSTAGPRAPVPPHPRLRWHIGAALTGLLVTPLGLWLLAGGMVRLAPIASGEPQLVGLLWVLAGAGALSLVAAVSAVGSSLGLVVGGAVWGVLPGLLGVAGLLGPVLDRSGAEGADRVTALELLLPTGFMLAAGTVLVSAGVAVHHARRAGQRQERAEVELVAASAAGPGPRAPVPPASRLRAHLASAAVALVLLPLSLVMLSRAAGWLSAVETGTATWTSDLPSVLALVAALALLSAVMLTAAVSSLGPQLAGWLLALLPAAGVLLWDLTGWWWLEIPISAVTRTPGSQLLVGTDFLLYLGVVMIVGGAAAHWARRHGRHLERSELELTAR